MLSLLVPSTLLFADPSRAGDVAQRKSKRVAPIVQVDEGGEAVDVVEPAEPKGHAPDKKTLAAIEKALLQPMKNFESKRSKYSRAGPPPSDRRVRVLDDEMQKDQKGETFVAFTVDARYGRGEHAEWNPDEITGCAYPSSGKVYVQLGDTWRTASFYAGKKSSEAPEHVCRSSTTLAAK